jgi:flagellar protein FlgJ
MSDLAINNQASLAMMQGQNVTAPRLAKAANQAQVQKTARDFESMVISQMLQPMFSGLSTEAPFGGGHAESMWRQTMIEEMAKEMTKTGGIGLADDIAKEMLKMQEMGNNGR